MVVIKGDTTCPDVLAFSLYYKRPMHMISIVADNVKCTYIKKKFYSIIYKKNVDMTFHHLKVIHMYNFGMGSVDVAD